MFWGNIEILGKYMWLEICISYSEISIEVKDKEYLSHALNFMTFGNMSKKLWPNMLLFSPGRQSGQIRKIQFFQKQKFEIDSLELYIHVKLWIIPFWSTSQKLQGVLVCKQLWNLYSKINFEVLYFTQFSIFFEKNKMRRCRLSITKLQWFLGHFSIP